MLDEFAEIDTDPKPTPIVSIFQMMLVLRRGSVAAKEGQRVGRS
jgi:hypothetical protein